MSSACVTNGKCLLPELKHEIIIRKRRKICSVAFNMNCQTVVSESDSFAGITHDCQSPESEKDPLCSGSQRIRTNRHVQLIYVYDAF